MQGLATITRATGRGSCATARRELAAAPRRVEVDLSSQAVEQVAAQVAKLLEGQEERSSQRLISAGELALRLGVERPWVYRHRHLLGGIRIGTGLKAPWRFDYRMALERLREGGDVSIQGGGSQ